ncbi:HNH endonuclease [Mixta gaviniae]|uniref:HNH endonuclease n=1 Tax=Mixta gaviniae TaxID=665914 RepID=A0A2L0IGD2_9GAMM|nr:HNH endonuclease signature motif containing protein [Mixta gaviniae]AUX93661.1 HNH endonuclease [Mixta gaviniae]
MPSAIPRACRKGDGPKTTTDRSGYCNDHHNEGWQQHQRGYGSTWDIIRARILKRDRHICQQWLANGRPVPAFTVDHIKPKAHGGTDEDSNLVAICFKCHKAKTARDRLNRS